MQSNAAAFSGLPIVNRRPIVWATLAMAAVFALLPDLAHAQASTDSVEQAVIDLTTLLAVIGVGIVTIAIMIAGYKMAFQAARFSDVANILIGGTLAGGATGLAPWIFG
jgi:type IV secretion system protein VirB2